MNQADIIVPIALQHTQTATCTAPWYVKHTEYHPLEATYEPLINGEEAFRAVHLAIAEAKKSVDIICWGFQPSMFFIRDGKAPCIGELLMEKARHHLDNASADEQIANFTAALEKLRDQIRAIEAKLQGKDFKQATVPGQKVRSRGRRGSSRRACRRRRRDT